VSKYPKHEFDNQSDTEVVSALVQQIRLNPISLHYEDAEKKAEPTTVTGRNQFGDTVEVPGLLVTKKFKFSGDRRLWSLRVANWSGPVPQGLVENGTITIGMEVLHNKGEDAVNYIKSTVDQIEQHLEGQKKIIVPFNIDLLKGLLPFVQARRKRHDDAERLISKF